MMTNEQKQAPTLQEVLTRLTGLCAQGEHCRHELREKMRRWGADSDVQDEAMAYLEEHRFVDEERYARAFVKDKLKYNKWGPRKITQALWAKHIDDHVQRVALGEVTNDDYLRILRPLLENKRRTTRAGSHYELQAKLLRFAVGRGFTTEQVRACIGDIGADDE